jgi:hypothetical protein
MTIRATVLRESRHREFLQAQSQDPVTHIVFAAGDRVTRCAICLLPFLEQSWEAIGGIHCGQFASVALDGYESPPQEDGTTETVHTPTNSQPTAMRLELIPIELYEVPITLK